MTATIPEMKEPSARARTVNHTNWSQYVDLEAAFSKLTSKIGEIDCLRKDRLSNEKYEKKPMLAEEELRCRLDLEPRLFGNN